MISCTSEHRAAYGWQRDGGHADYLLAEEDTCVALPDELSYVDGALVACGFGTVYEALNRVAVSGQDRVLITGMGPVGMAAGLLAKKMGATQVIGADVAQSRLDFSLECGAIDQAVRADARRTGPDQGADRRAGLRGLGRLLRLAPGTAAGAARHAALGPLRHGGRGQPRRLST
jgi:D-arabinose 1-dehydrogenase-like Zn-dependent alcohol dehydrogenase